MYVLDLGVSVFFHVHISGQRCMLTHIDLFSGIGGMTLALKQISSPTLYCDICPHARALLQARIKDRLLPGAPIVSDVRDLSNRKLPHVDIVAGGWPCIGFSVAGANQGFENAQSSLFFNMLTVVRRCKPRIVFLENTPAVSRNEYLSVVIDSFEQMGYSLRHCSLPAYAVGRPHNRRRWFAIAFNCSQAFLNLLAKQLKTGLEIGLKVGKQPPRTVSTLPVDSATRFKLLKNAIVPACATTAFQHLCLNTVPPVPVAPMLNLQLKQGRTLIVKQLWPTPFGHFRYGSAVLTQRTASDLITAVKFETSTVPGYVSCVWIEWLMGYPRNWTLVSK